MNPEQRRLLADLLIQWEDLYMQGQDTPAEVLCNDHPELAQTLARQIAALKRVAWLDKKLDDDEGDDPSDDPPDDLRPPRLLAGRYRLDQLIATGGFAEVWRAFDQELQRIIAIKIPKRTVIGAADSFLAEARRVARLKHPSILPVYDVGLDGDDFFFVSEHVEGGSLADRLMKGRLPADQACRWISSIADAVEHAHTHGVIHRDIKPGNILIDAHDRSLLADFGIAQSSMKTGEFAPSIGTLRYMAPEQLDGQAAVPQSDIYSLGVVLHEALTGKPPYSSGEPNTLRREIGSGAKVSKDVPSHLVPVLRKALSKDPGQRFGSATEFAAAVRSLPKTRLMLPLAAAAIAAGLLIFAAFRSQQQTTEPATAAADQATAPAETDILASPATRKEMPYPLPPFNRRRWVATAPDAGKTFEFDLSTGWWSETDSAGKPAFVFRQTRLTDDFIDLADPHRPVWIRLKSSTAEICDSPDYHVTGILQRGSWADAEASPLPPALSQKISLTAPRDSLEHYVQRLSQMTGVPILLNLSALTLEGITKNQSFALDEQDQEASAVLMTILRKADPEDRLRPVLRTTDDGNTAIDITTKQALSR